MPPKSHVVRAEAARRLVDSRHLSRPDDADESPRRRQVRAERHRRPEGRRLRGGLSARPQGRGARRRRSARRGADVLVVRSTAGHRRRCSRRARCRSIVRAGAGYNTIDVAAASKRGIYVSNCPGKNAIAVAELAFALILALDRRIPDNVAELRAGTLEQEGVLEGARPVRPDARPARLRQHRPGGGEARARVRHAGRGLEPPVRRPAGRTSPTSRSRCSWRASPAEVAERSDVLSVHLALNADTRGLVNASVLDKLKPGSYFINTARAEVVDYAALEKAVRERDIRVGLDVFADEPTDGDRRVQGRDRRRCRTSTARITSARRPIRRRRRSRPRPCASSRPTRTPARCRTSSTWRRRRRRRTCSSSATATGPACWRTCSSTCASGDINVQETENIIFEGAAGRRRAHQPRRRAVRRAAGSRSRTATATFSICIW